MEGTISSEIEKINREMLRGGRSTKCESMTKINLLDDVISKTDSYISQKSKEERKKIGQFFTSKESAIFMASLFDLSQYNSVSICDPGAGTGILSVALIERIINETSITSVDLVCYENNSETAKVLEENLNKISIEISIDFSFRVDQKNYITSQKKEEDNLSIDGILTEKYDLVIGNPPYKKLAKNAAEANCLKDVCYGAPNIYFLFATMSIISLKEQGELVYIIPRSWTSGAYFKAFREFLFKNCTIDQMHLFVSRNKVFDKEDVLQETMIIKLIKNYNMNREKIIITASQNNHDFENISKLEVPYSIVVSDNDKYVYLVTKESEINVLERVHYFSKTLLDIGLKMKTGLTVDFRNKEFLFSLPGENLVPLFYSQNLKKGRVIFPNNEKVLQYVNTEKKGLIQKNQNYLFMKRFTAKEEKRRLQCAMYFSKDFPDLDYISTQNKINFITTIDGTCMNDALLAGLYVLFNSSLFDYYYRILNGSTQVNSTEINSIPVPERSTIIKMGQKLLSHEDISTDVCDKIMEDVYGKN